MKKVKDQKKKTLLAHKRFEKKLKRKHKVYNPKKYYVVQEGRAVEERMVYKKDPKLVTDTDIMQLQATKANCIKTYT